MVDNPPPKLPKGRTYAEFEPLLPAEKKLLQHAAVGTLARVGTARPSNATADNRVRADFIRFLALGGDGEAPVHEKGVQLEGAWIEGELDLGSTETKGGLFLINSRFAHRPMFLDTHFRGPLNLGGSEVPGLSGDRLICDASVFFRNGFLAAGEVRLLGAKIGGDLVCSGGGFKNSGNYALSADGMQVDGNVFLRLDAGAMEAFHATGQVRLLGAKIRGNLECHGGRFENQGNYAVNADAIEVGGNIFLGMDADAKEGFHATGQVRLVGAKISGDLTFRGGRFRGADIVINLEKSRTDGSLIIDAIEIESGTIILADARISSLVDGTEPWPAEVLLDGLVYGSLAGKAPTDAQSRIAWLDRQPEAFSGRNGDGSNFRPQPWQQLRKVLREMGHYEAAREVGIEFESRKRRCGLIGGTPERAPGWLEALRAPKWLWPAYRCVYRFMAKALHRGYGLLVDYGYRPVKLLFWALAVLAVCAGGFYFAARNDGVFVPTETRIYQEHGAACGAPDHVRWTDCKAIEGEYPLFYPAVYSLNVLLPVGNLGQEAAWRPMTTTWPGIVTQLAVWFETLFGWGASLILVAVISGLAKHDERAGASDAEPLPACEGGFVTCVRCVRGGARAAGRVLSILSILSGGREGRGGLCRAAPAAPFFYPPLGLLPFARKDCTNKTRDQAPEAAA